MKAIILAAGRGERMRPLTEDVPKPMIPVNGKPLLWHNLKLLKRNGIENVAINLSYLPHKVRNYFGDGSELGMKILYSYEKELLGTSGALNNFRDFFDERFLVLYGDNFTNLDLSKMYNFHVKKESLATLFLHEEKLRDSKTTPGIVTTDKNKRITGIFERPSKKEIKYLEKIPEENKLTNSGLYILEKEVLEYIPEREKSDFAQDVFPELLKKNKKIYGYTSECFYRELGSMSRYNLTLEEIQKGRIELNEEGIVFR